MGKDVLPLVEISGGGHGLEKSGGFGRARGARRRKNHYGNRRNGRAFEGLLPGETPKMNRLIALLALTGAFAVAACDDPRPAEDEDLTQVPVEEPAAPAAEDAGAQTDATATQTPTPPTDSTAHPAEKRTSEESVQPESETLFY